MSAFPSIADALVEGADTTRRWRREDVNDRIARERADEESRQRQFARDNEAAGQQAFAKLNVGVDGAEPASREQAMLTVAEARADHALKAGNVAAFAEHFGVAAKMRAAMRAQDYQRADERYVMTRDFNEYLPALSRWKNGVTIEKIEPVQDTSDDGVGGVVRQPSGRYKITSKVGDKTGEKVVGEDEVKQLINFARDPAAAYAVEVERAKEEAKSRTKMREKTHDTNEEIRKTLNDPSKRYHNVPEDNSVIDSATNQVIRTGGAGSAKVDPQQRLLDNDIADTVMRIPGMFTSNPENGVKSYTTEGQKLAETAQMLRRSLGSSVPPDAVVAMVQRGKLGTMRSPDGSQTIPAIQVDGKTIPLNVQPTSLQMDPRTATPGINPNAPAPGAQRVAPEGAAGTSGRGDRLSILQQERVNLARQIQAAQSQPNPNDPQELARLQAQVPRLEREIQALMGPGVTPADALAGPQPAAQPAPAAPVPQPAPQSAAPAPINLRTIDNRMEPAAAKASAAVQLASAQRAVEAAKSRALFYGRNGKSPEAQQAMADYERAQAALKKAQAQFEATLTPAERQAMARQGLPNSVANAIPTGRAQPSPATVLAGQ